MFCTGPTEDEEIQMPEVQSLYGNLTNVDSRIDMNSLLLTSGGFPTTAGGTEKIF